MRVIARIVSCSAALSSITAFGVRSSYQPVVAFKNTAAHPLPYSSTATKLAMTSSDEVQKAIKAAEEKNNVDDGDGQPPTIFDKIISGEIPAEKIHDDELCIAFRDVNPQSPVHFLVIPKNRDGLTQLSKAREDQKELLGHLMFVAQNLGQKVSVVD